MTCTHPVRAVRSSDGKLVLCCFNCEEQRLPEDSIWVCADCAENSEDPSGKKTTRLYWARYQDGLPPLASKHAATYLNGDCVQRLDYDYLGYSNPQADVVSRYMSTAFGLCIRANWISLDYFDNSGFNVWRVNISVLKNDFSSNGCGFVGDDYKNPENHPGWEFELTFPVTGAGQSQEVVLTFPDSPIAELTGSVRLVFGNTEQATLANCELDCCDYPGDFVGVFNWSQITQLNTTHGPIRAKDWLYHYETDTQFSKCGKTWSWEPPTYQQWVPTANSDGLRTESWMGDGGEYFHDTGNIGGDIGQYTWRDTMVQQSTVRNSIFRNMWRRFLWDGSSGLGYSTTTDLEGQDGVYDCGMKIDVKGCPNDETCITYNDNNLRLPEINGAVGGHFTCMGYKTQGDLYLKNNGSSTLTAWITIGASTVENGVGYGGLPPGQVLFPGTPIVGFPYDAIEPSCGWCEPWWGAFTMDFDFFCSGVPGNAWIVAWPAMLVDQIKEDHPSNPNGLNSIRVGEFSNQQGHAQILNINCTQKGTYNFVVPTKWSVSYWGGGFAGGTYDVPCSITFY